MYRKVRIENVSEIDSICLGGQAQQIGIRIEAPGEASFSHTELGFVLPEKDLLSNTAISIAVCDSYSV